MLTKSEEIEAVQNAKELGIRNPNRSRTHFHNILNRFFSNVIFNRQHILDLGPGHYDFCELVREKGASPFAIELDDAVIKLGELKNINVIKGNLTDNIVYESFKNKIDGLFCRGSINACWFINKPEEQEKYIDSMLSVLNENGFAWISPCNEGGNDITLLEYNEVVQKQIELFENKGFRVLKINKIQAYRYGIWSSKPKLIYTKNLKYINFPW